MFLKMFHLFAIHSKNAAKHLVINPAILARTVKTEVPIKWERPVVLSKYSRERSGDLARYVQPDQSNICLQYRFGTAFDDAEPNVRNQFTLGWHPAEYSREFYEKEMMDSVQSHVYDCDSDAVLIAQVTANIRYMQYCIEEGIVHNRKRAFYRTETKRLIKYRAELIRMLREKDYKQYEWLLERLDLQYKPPPEKENQIMIARKEGLRQLTKAYCDDVRQRKLDEYRSQLENQQVTFLEQKLKNLEFIRNEQMALKVAVTITQEQIDELRKQYTEQKIAFDANQVAPSKKKWKVY